MEKRQDDVNDSPMTESDMKDNNFNEGPWEGSYFPKYKKIKVKSIKYIVIGIIIIIVLSMILL